MAETKHLQDIYLSGIMVRDSGKYMGARRFEVLLWCILKYFKHHFAFSPDLNLYAVALNQDSEKILTKLKFKVHLSGSHRADRHNLYKVQYTKDYWEEILRSNGDYSLMCKITYK